MGNSAVVQDLYTVLDLPPEQFQQAYPLIETTKRDLALDQWLEYASELHHRPDKAGGVLSVQCGNRYIYALAAYIFGPGYAEPRIAQVEHLCVVDLLNKTAGQMLVEALEERAHSENCLEIRVNARENRGMRGWCRHQVPMSILQSRGYVIGDNFISKRFQ